MCFPVLTNGREDFYLCGLSFLSLLSPFKDNSFKFKERFGRGAKTGFQKSHDELRSRKPGATIRRAYLGKPRCKMDSGEEVRVLRGPHLT